jgi:ABC-type glycerol-3-phosphate transport system substrate-binding protein
MKFPSTGRVVVVLSCLLLLPGCGGGGSDESRANEPLRFWHAMGGALGQSLDGLVEDYNASGKDVESVSMGKYQALSQKIMASVAAGGPPDVAQCYEAWTANLVENGSVVAFDGFLEGPEGVAALDDFYGIFLEGSRQQGQLWSFPFNKSVRCLYYNKDRFREAGLDPDRPPRTWEEYRSIARQLTRDLDGDGRNDEFGLACQISASMFENLLYQNGGRLLNEEETQVAFDSPEGLEALEFMTDLLVRDGSALVVQGFEYQNEFLAGKAAMIEGSSVSLAFIEGKYTFELGIAPLPAGKHGAAAARLGIREVVHGHAADGALGRGDGIPAGEEVRDAASRPGGPPGEVPRPRGSVRATGSRSGPAEGEGMVRRAQHPGEGRHRAGAARAHGAGRRPGRRGREGERGTRRFLKT